MLRGNRNIYQRARVILEKKRYESFSRKVDNLTGHTDRAQCLRDTLEWLKNSQDNSKSRDGGFARHYNLLSGWSSSYPETTGYIIPTLLKCSDMLGITELSNRAERALDWLVSIQLPDGSFQGGTIEVQNVVPVAFNTGQIVLGLASSVKTFGEKYTNGLVRASDWLVENQDSNGSWTTFRSPFGGPGLKSYDTHIAWGLFEAARITANESYAGAAKKNIEWSLAHQNSNGWPRHCCLIDPTKPLTHTLGYYLRGIIEAYRYTGDPKYIESSMRMSRGIRDLVQDDGFLPGRIGSDWSQQSAWSCLTGSVQIAACFFLITKILGSDCNLLGPAKALNKYVVNTIKKNGPVGIRGGVSGSYPLSGAYNPYMFLNWSAKFAVDSFLMEEETY